MTQIHFYDDTNELLIGNAVDLIINKDETVEEVFYDSIEGYEKIIDLINNIDITTECINFTHRNQTLENYKSAIDKYIQTPLQKHFLDRIKIDRLTITVPFKVYLIINIKGEINLALDNLGYYKNLNTETVDEEFTAKHNELLKEYTNFYTKLLCKCSIATHYYLCEDIYEKLKNEFKYLENPERGVTGILFDKKLPILREFIRALENYSNGKKVKTIARPTKLFSEMTEVGSYRISNEEREHQHYTLDYIIFSLLFLRKAPLIIITRDFHNIELGIGYEICITSYEGLKRLIKESCNFIVVNPFQGLDDLVEEYTDEQGKSIIKEGREMSQSLWKENTTIEEKIKKCMEFICNKLNQYEKIEFKINTKDRQPYSITQIVTQCNPDKFYETKASFTNPVKTTSIEDPGKKERRIYESTKPLSEI